ncbi:1-(5-phosphoribosyl)-5-[(5-phosphoribosylamino)methylideneamino]imidazole-4-carboxamide isomerase [Staphylospora marina]|uniref:1-(5-phosphoribosyl)-5-[(5- phosphoribosylamino)methylideneamino]imidazole-4- carboxamide isomerase n=1 Tax=Staphylospora marina TaxID=2490858 RepID=UPI000F5C1D06|nr:1-(5-phosphoribosyl)-5-[(5-phosphoribosylamino)methylideneamino]imidazole-4-carboxamide isomerase [Staphylospora marina]
MNGFDLYPAIDILGGKCVRLVRGDYTRETVYAENPVDMALRWVEQGAAWLHVVDLDAAKSGTPVNDRIIRDICARVPVPVQVGGGVRDIARIEALLEAGVSRVIMGSAAVDRPDVMAEALKRYKDRIAVGIDAKDGRVATHGWLEVTDVPAEVLALEMARLGAERFVYTDISRDGTLSGVSLESTVRLAEACGKPVIASGGVRSVEDLRNLAALKDRGIAGAIIGKALYTGAVRMDEALRAVGGDAA